MSDANLTSHSLARMIDISAVQAQHTVSDVRELATHALSGDFIAAHVLPGWVPILAELLAGSTTNVGSPVGFPSGGTSTDVKVREAHWLVEAGVNEMDIVINVGRLKSGDKGYVADDLRAVLDAVAGRVPTKIILEAGLLTRDEIVQGTTWALEAGADFLKTGTGWQGHPTSIDDVATMRTAAGEGPGIKASGGVRTLADVTALLDAGATRFGMNTRAALAVLKEVDA